MKLSIAWIFDHLDVDWQSIDIPALIKKFNVTTAEIEGFSKIDLDLCSFSLARVSALTDDQVIVYSPEWNKQFTLAARADACVNDVFLIVKKDGAVTWATALDLQGTKEGNLPAFWCTEKEFAGEWKKSFEAQDYILELDNKSVTNRPDLWGHRGFAREISAILNVPLRPLEQFIAQQPIKEYADAAPATVDMPIAITNQAPQACRRFAGMYISQIEHKPSLLWLAHRLMRVETRAIDLLVDLTNYAMLDVSQPMHVFDADKLSDKQIVPRMAKKGEKLELLDGQTIDLTPQDLIITDGRRPVALAGVMGGLLTAEDQGTTNIFVESANFAPVTIRLSSTRHKIRTESSARFEKGLDPNQNTVGIARFLKLLHDTGIVFDHAGDIVSVGKPVVERVIELRHEFLQNRVGAQITPEFVVSALEKIGFSVERTGEQFPVYAIKVPAFRANDITLPEDIVEEIARFFGYTNLALVLPEQKMQTSDLNYLLRVRTIKRHMAYVLKMHEVRTYALHDQNFLRQIQWQPEDPVRLQNPISSNMYSLLVSLIPAMLQSVQENSASKQLLRFFQWGRTWHKYASRPKDTLGFVIGQEGPFVLEKKALAGIMFDGKNTVDFYQAKSQLDSLFSMLSLPVSWAKAEKIAWPWYHEYQTAYLMHDGQRIGIAGKISPLFFAHVADGDAFIFELDADFLLRYKIPTPIYRAPSKYPHVWFDISLLAPIALTVEQLTYTLQSVDSRITSVQLIDLFVKDEWADRKALTFRYVIQDETKTLKKNEIDRISTAVVAAVNKLGAQVR